jgi:hypothetical protein
VGNQKPKALANFIIEEFEDILTKLHIKKIDSYLGWITSNGIALSFSFIFVSLVL